MKELYISPDVEIVKYQAMEKLAWDGNLEQGAASDPDGDYFVPVN